ncbi:hypothetical protein [Falsirhodobacter sp. 20TX0035]|uniref:hypothetical protein n=1 Tax=Falsirhodobacter sp. 20TX0035 TaxID=3022019 RepID=UPI00232C5D0A|nr:hypothetical protein [Falsirhodobacter sp. 20TX0035]MDB6454717.1 hypothetical protein [Falsirhodobacter sp. 20TX0035]
MGIHTVPQPEQAILAQCAGKDRLTPAQAHEIARRPGKQFDVYRCKHCGQHHVTHAPAKPFRRRKH